VQKLAYNYFRRTLKYEICIHEEIYSSVSLASVYYCSIWNILIFPHLPSKNVKTVVVVVVTAVVISVVIYFICGSGFVKSGDVPNYLLHQAFLCG